MKGAGLTRGGFYNHFSSKRDLYAEAVRSFSTCNPFVRETERLGGHRGPKEAARDSPTANNPHERLEPTMKKFLAVYIGTATAHEKAGWEKMDPEKRKKLEAAGLKAWMEWGEAHASAIVDQGSPLGKTKRAANEGIADITNSMVGYVIVQAESHEAAAKMFAQHPHFAIFPGDSVEIMECLPLPKR